MIDTSAAYKTAIKASARQIVPKVEIYFDGDNETPATFEGDEIANLTLLEEARSDSKNPLGFVTANEFSLSLDNSNRDFTPTAAGAYSDKIRPNLLVKPYLGLVLSETTEYIPLGVFRTGDWETPSQQLEATVTCYDNLYSLFNLDTPQLKARQETTIGFMFQDLFEALGLSEEDYLIDEALNQSVRIGWHPRGTVGDTLQTLADAAFASVRTDREGRIVVKSNLTVGELLETYTDDNSIFATENPQKILDIYSVVRIGYRLPYIKQPSTLIEIDNLTIPNGGLTIEDIEFDTQDIPVVEVQEVRLLGATSSEVESFSFGATGATIEISNTGTSETVTLLVLGRGVGSHTSSRTAVDEEAIGNYGRRELTFFNPLIQRLDVAQSYAVKLLALTVDPLNNYTIDFRGDMALEIGDLIQVVNPSDKIGTVEVIPFRIQLEFDGGLNATMMCKKG